MAETIRLELVTPERQLVNDDVDEVVAPGVEGDFGVLPEHTPFLTALRVGELIYKKQGKEDFVAIENGFLEVTGDRVIVLAEHAEHGREIDLDEAIRRKVEAEKQLSEQRAEDEREFRKAEAELMRELVRVSVAEKMKG